MRLRSRYRNNQHLRRFPLELWHESIAHLTIADLKDLSLTCRLLHGISIPFIFKNIEYRCIVVYSESEPSWDLKQKRDDIQRHADSFREFVETTKCASLVRRLLVSYVCHIAPIPGTSGKTILKEKETYKDFLDTFTLCLERFSNLKGVEVSGLMGRIDKKMLDALARRSPLDAVWFSGVSFAPHEIKQLITAKQICIDSRNAESEAIMNSKAKTLNFFSGENLESLGVWSDLYAPRLFRALGQQGRLERLTDISVYMDADNLMDLYAFLPSCPNVKRMQVRLVGLSEGSQFSPPPASTVPLVESFLGSECAAAVFVPGRPVKKVVIDRRYWTENRFRANLGMCLLPLSQSTGPVVQLFVESVGCTKKAMVCLVGYFPSLEELGVSLPRKTLLEDEVDLLIFPEDVEEDEGHYAPSCADAYEDPIGGGHDLRRWKHFCYVHFHTEYLNLLSSIAAKKIVIPSRLRALFLHEDAYDKFEIERLPASDDEEEGYVERFGVPFSASGAEDVLNRVSRLYPTLERVVVCKEYKGGLQWTRGYDGRWVYYTDFDLVRFQVGLFYSASEVYSVTSSFGDEFLTHMSPL